jgi:hypothetical protein
MDWATIDDSADRLNPLKMHRDMRFNLGKLAVLHSHSLPFANMAMGSLRGAPVIEHSAVNDAPWMQIWAFLSGSVLAMECLLRNPCFAADLPHVRMAELDVRESTVEDRFKILAMVRIMPMGKPKCLASSTFLFPIQTSPFAIQVPEWFCRDSER